MKDTYICKLSERFIKQAKDELNEIPSDRLSAVQKLREWVQQQPHLVARTDTDFLLRFLRVAKFSQLRAREVIENYHRLKIVTPQYITRWDVHEDIVRNYIQSRTFVPLPGYNKDGSKTVIHRFGAVQAPNNEITKEFKNAVMRTWHMVINYFMLSDENVQVSGITFIFDFTDAKVSIVMMYNPSEVRDIWRFQDSYPGRFKGFLYYNEGQIIDAFLALARPFIKKKLLSRLKFYGSNLEEMYKDIEKSRLPVEYLPDDYKGPNAGTFDSLAEELWIGLSQPEMVAALKEESHPRWTIDMSKKPKDEAASSFRKLNIE